MIAWVVQKGGGNIEIEHDLRPGNIDWNGMWNEELRKVPGKDDAKIWTKIAPKFDQWMKKDDYPHKLAGKIHKEPQYTVLDLGCGNGTLTLEVASHVKEVTAVDMSGEMLRLVKKNAAEKGISNIKYLQSTIEDLKIDQIGQHDVVIASRSLGGIYDVKKELKKIDGLARKSVYLTLWGAEAKQFEKDVSKFIGAEYHQHPDYIYAYNMLYQLGIYANVEMLESKTRPIYCDLDDAMERCLWKLRWGTSELNEEKESKLKNFLRENLDENEDGTLDYPTNNPNWVLLWWKKD